VRVNAQVKVPAIVAGMTGGADRLLLAELVLRVPLLPGRETLAFIDIHSQRNGSTAARSRTRRSVIPRFRARACWSAG